MRRAVRQWPGKCPHGARAWSCIRVGFEIGERVHRLVVQIEPAGIDKGQQSPPIEPVLCGRCEQRCRDWMTLRLAAGLNAQNIAPPLQPDLAGQRLLHHLANTCDFEVERV